MKAELKNQQSFTTFLPKITQIYQVKRDFLWVSTPTVSNYKLLGFGNGISWGLSATQYVGALVGGKGARLRASGPERAEINRTGGTPSGRSFGNALWIGSKCYEKNLLCEAIYS